MVDYVPLPDLTLCSQLNVSFSRDDSIIPYTVGTHFRPANEVFLTFDIRYIIVVDLLK